MVEAPRLHLVGGFLGSGKTTAIIQAARRLMGEGKRLGIITNDQGKVLVDTAFFRLADLPTVEVTGGCFCCSYPDLEQQLDTLVKTVHPDVIFAESVGSCADLVATVVKPLSRLRQSPLAPASFSVFVDARLLRLHLQGADLPFSDEVVYIFTQQMEEAGLLVINKVDLLTPGQVEELLVQARLAFPGKPMLIQSSLSSEGVEAWIEQIENGRSLLPDTSLSLDYARYTAGETRLSWINASLEIAAMASGETRPCVLAVIHAVLDLFTTQPAAIGHLKFLVMKGGGSALRRVAAGSGAKISFTSLPEPGWDVQVPDPLGPVVTLLVNGRAEAAGDLGARFAEGVMEAAGSGAAGSGAVSDAAGRTGCQVTIRHLDAFTPRPPNPTYRMMD